MSILRILLALAFVTGLSAGVSLAADAKDSKNKTMVCAFENEDDIGTFDMGKTATAEIVKEHATEGKMCAKVTVPADGDTNFFYVMNEKFKAMFPSDWTEYKTLKIDVFSESERPVKLEFRVSSDNFAKKYESYPSIPVKKAYTITIDLKSVAKKINIADVESFKFYTNGSVPFEYILYFDNLRMEK